MFHSRRRKMRRKAYISRFFILYLNPISLILYGLGCYHLFQYNLDGKIKSHILVFACVSAFFVIWFLISILITVHLKVQDAKRKSQSEDKNHCICCKQTIFHVVSVFFVTIFLCITGITIGGICCNLNILFL